MSLPRGIVSVVQTPFANDGSLDSPSLERLIEDSLASQVNGFLVPAVASEVAYLSPAERMEIIRTVVRIVHGRVPIIVGASSATPEECHALAEQGLHAGGDAYLIAVPERLYSAPQQLVPFFQQATAGITRPLVIQDLQFQGPGLTLPQMAELQAALPHLAGWKVETVPAGPKYSAVREAFGSHCHISGGWAVPQLIEALDRGVDAMIPESSMIRVYQRIVQEYQAGHRDAAMLRFRRLLPILAYTNQELVTSIAFFKRLLHRKGIFSTPTLRVPGFAWDRWNTRIADELIEHYLALERDC